MIGRNLRTFGPIDQFFLSFYPITGPYDVKMTCHQLTTISNTKLTLFSLMSSSTNLEYNVYKAKCQIIGQNH